MYTRQKIAREELLSRYAAGERDFPNIWINIFVGDDLSGQDLSGINLEGSRVQCDFNGAIFRGANLRHSDWVFPNAKNVDFSGSDLTGFISPQGCILRNCNFSNTVWNQADLWNTKFVSCDIRGANFGNAKFEGVEFIGCISDRKTNLSDFCGRPYSWSELDENWLEIE